MIDILQKLKQIRRFDGNMSREQNQRYYELETELDRLQKKEQEGQMIEKIFGFDINDIRLICALINERFMSKDDFHEALRNFQKAYQKGYDDCYAMVQKHLDENVKNLLRSDEK